MSLATVTALPSFAIARLTGAGAASSAALAATPSDLPAADRFASAMEFLTTALAGTDTDTASGDAAAAAGTAADAGASTGAGTAADAAAVEISPEAMFVLASTSAAGLSAASVSAAALPPAALVLMPASAPAAGVSPTSASILALAPALRPPSALAGGTAQATSVTPDQLATVTPIRPVETPIRRPGAPLSAAPAAGCASITTAPAPAAFGGASGATSGNISGANIAETSFQTLPEPAMSLMTDAASDTPPDGATRRTAPQIAVFGDNPTALTPPAAPPAATPTTATAPLTPSPAPPAAAVTQPLAAQMFRPLFSLAGAADGNHTLTISVTPDDLGPVTVRAHVSADGIRIELFSPSDGGRDALRQIMTDLRRDLAASGISANLDLSSKSQPDSGGTANQANTGERRDGRNPPVAALVDHSLRRPATAGLPIPHRAEGTDSTLDVMA